MKRRSWSFTLIEMLIVMAIIGILAGILLPALMGAREQSRRKICSNNLGQIGKACISYQEPNGDYYPAFEQAIYADAPYNGLPNTNIPGSGQGADGAFQPMPSLACLYPTYVPEFKVFACPSTNDTPQIAVQYYNVSANVQVLHTCFGFAWYDTTGRSPNVSPTDPATFTGKEVGGVNKCSYLYDELVQPRDCTAEQAIAADADGQTWLLPGGKHPPYAPGWVRAPHLHDWPAQPVSKPNHDNGQNVMYLDGHVKWGDTNYCSHDPTDDIFTPQYDFTSLTPTPNPDADAYLWDGSSGDALGQSQ